MGQGSTTLRQVIQRSMGWTLSVLGGVISVFGIALTVYSLSQRMWIDAAGMLASLVFIGALAALAGWRMIRSPLPPRDLRGPKGAVRASVLAVLVVPLLLASGWLLPHARGSAHSDLQTAVSIVWVVAMFASFFVLRRISVKRGGSKPMTWAVTEGTVVGMAEGLTCAFQGRGWPVSIIAGLGYGLFLGGLFGLYIAWMRRSVKPWATENKVPFPEWI